MDLSAKYTNLLSVLRDIGPAAIAFSGGVDSTLLLHVAAETLGTDKVLAITATSEAFPAQECEESRALAIACNTRHILLPVTPLDDPRVAANGRDRCYFCKRLIFSACLGKARELGFPFLLDGTNADDDLDHRPGTQAARELGVRSPLQETGLTKAEIRELSRQRSLPTWNKPPLTCTMTRFPYGVAITPQKLAQVRRCEAFLLARGFSGFRVRYHGDVARLEIAPCDFGRFQDTALRTAVAEAFRDAGFTYVALDLDGYRQGSLNAGSDTPSL